MANPIDGLKRGTWSKWKKGSDDWTNNVMTNTIGIISDSEIDTLFE